MIRNGTLVVVGILVAALGTAGISYGMTLPANRWLLGGPGFFLLFFGFGIVTWAVVRGRRGGE